MNDYAVPGNSDRFLTNEFYIKSGAWKIGNEIYTPRNKRSTEVNTGDRPWDGYSYIEHELKTKAGYGEELLLKSRLGLLGKASGSQALQTYIHDDLGLGAHPTYSGQNPSEPAVDFIASKRTREYLQSIFGDTSIRQEYGARFGTVNNSIFLDQELRKHFFDHWYFYGGIRGDVVAYNTHLDGRLFHSDLYTVNKQWFVASGRIGFEYYVPEWDHFFIGYGYVYLTEEFEGQEGRHSYGSLTFGKKF